MKKIFLFIFPIFIFLFFALASQAQAANHYIRTLDNGETRATQNGNTWVTAWTDLPTSFVRGDIYYVADGTYGSHTFGPTTGDTSQYVAIKKATKENSGNVSGWQDVYGDGQAVFSAENINVLTFKTAYWKLDGVTGGGPNSWTSNFGFKVTATGTMGAVNLMYLTNGGGLDVHHIDIEHIDFAHRGMHYPPTGDDAIYEAFGEIPLPLTASASRLNTHDITFRYCWIHNTCRTNVLNGRGYNWLFEYNYFSDNNSIGAPGYKMCADTSRTCTDNSGCGLQYSCKQEYNSIGSETTGNKFCVLNNNMVCSDSGTENSCPDGLTCINLGQQHSESIAAYGNKNFIIRYNMFADIYGTSNIALKENNNENFDSWEIYGNVFFRRDSSSEDLENGMGAIANTSTSTGGVTNFKVYNNTFTNLMGNNSGVNFLGNCANNFVYNNLWYNCVKAGFSGTNHDYNYLINTPIAYGSSKNTNEIVVSSGNPFINTTLEDYRLSATIGRGKSLLTPYNIDMAGNIRTNWDYGAYEYTDGQTTCVLGDLDCVGGVTITDIQIAVNVFLGIETDQVKRTRANVDTSNPDITIADIQKVVNIFLNID